MNNTWALVLAAGEGSRLRALTTHRGVAVPKQFCSLVGGPSLLEEAILRAEAIVPRQRVCTVVAEQHRVWWEEALRFMPRRNVIVQPQNRGTAVGLLLPLLHIAQRDPQARVVILPSDHYVRDEAVLARSLRQAASRKQEKLDPRTLIAAGFMVLVTSLPAEIPAEEICAVYRLRWQIELAFKRMKSLLHVDRIPTRTTAGGLSWLYPHLILTLLTEDICQDFLESSP